MAEGVGEPRAGSAPRLGVVARIAAGFGPVSRRLAREGVGPAGVGSRPATTAEPRGVGREPSNARARRGGNRTRERLVRRFAAATAGRAGAPGTSAVLRRFATGARRRVENRTREQAVRRGAAATAGGAGAPRTSAGVRRRLPSRRLDRILRVGLAGAGLALAVTGCSPKEPGAGRAGNGTGADTAAAAVGETGKNGETAAPAGGGAVSLPRPGLHPGMPGVLNEAEIAALGAARERALGEIAHLPEFGFGEAAGPERIAAWDIDIGPDGEGLPAGRGSVERGETLYRLQCVQCHGLRGEGADFEALAGRVPGDAFPFAEQWRYPITVGSYWPYATTLFDYLRRAMPQAAPGTLPPDDVYSLTAYVLHLNDLLEPGATLDADSLPRIVMPARDRFVRDDRRGGPEVR